MPGDPCLRCLWPEQPAAGLAGSCVESGVLGPVPGVLGTMQAMEALKLLLGLPQPADHALQLVNLLDGSSQRLPIDAAQGCALHGGCVEVARQALERARGERRHRSPFRHLEDAIAAGYVMVDVREPDEIAAAAAACRPRCRFRPAARWPAPGRAHRWPGAAGVRQRPAQRRRLRAMLRAAGRRCLFAGRWRDRTAHAHDAAAGYAARWRRWP